LALIEDATESLGAKYRGRHTGSVGGVGVFSFNGNKIITTGGGGMLVTNNGAWAAKAKYLTTQAKDDPLEYVHNEIGYNYRLTNVQAAIGCAQMELLDEYTAAKRHIASVYTKALNGIAGLTLPRQAAWAESTWWMYTVLVDRALYGEDSRSLLKRLAVARIQTRPLWQPCHLSPAHRGCQAYHCEVAERLNRDALSLPCSVALSTSQQQSVTAAVRRGN
jgi:perosamine synthetase